MKSSLIALAGIAAALLAFPGCAQEDSTSIKAAEASSEQWLQSLDAADYRTTWQSAAAVFQKGVSERGWEQAARSVREPLGSVVARKLKTAQFSRTLPGAPDGEYVVIQYDTRFQHKAQAIETVTPMLDADGTWKVSGYYVR
ncbi:MAG: DUF4019 domain-containing protein [Rhodanobacteraceae bacterium]